MTGRGLQFATGTHSSIIVSERMLQASLDTSIEAVLLEGDALSASLSVVDCASSPERARELVLEALQQMGKPRSPCDHVKAVAMKKIAGETFSLPSVKPDRSNQEARRASSIAIAWLFCISGQTEQASQLLGKIPILRECRPGAVHRVTLDYWQKAVFSLIQKDRTEASRYWRRAMELGSSFGTDSHPIISWTYAATFFRDPSPQK